MLAVVYSNFYMKRIVAYGSANNSEPSIFSGFFGEKKTPRRSQIPEAHKQRFSGKVYLLAGH